MGRGEVFASAVTKLARIGQEVEFQSLARLGTWLNSPTTRNQLGGIKREHYPTKATMMSPPANPINPSEP